MKLEEAIEITEATISPDIPSGDFRGIDALRLLIEAGKRVQKDRTFPYTLPLPLLPGETED